MRSDSPFCLEGIMLFIILLLFTRISDAKPIDYEDVANLLPTEPQTTNDTLAAIVRDPVVQDAVQNTVGNGSLEGLVVKKKVLIMPATEPAKVVSQREQILVVPMTHLEDVRKNITETVNMETDIDGLVFTDAQLFTEGGEDATSGNESNQLYTSQHGDFSEELAEISKTTRKSTLPLDNAPQEIPPSASQEMEISERPSPTISVPIIAFLDPATKIYDDRINVPIAAALPERDDIPKSQSNLFENERDEIQQNVQNYVDENPWNMDPRNWRLTLSPSEIPVSSLMYEPSTIENQYVNDVRSKNSLPVIPIDIITPPFWTLNADVNYLKDPQDMDTAADIVFRPLFKFRQEAQQRSWRRSANNYRRSSYQKYNSYNSYPRRNYRYRPRYSDDYYY